MLSTHFYFLNNFHMWLVECADAEPTDIKGGAVGIC